MSTHGTVWWNELNTHHPDKAIKFYTGLFGWKAHTSSMVDMTREPKPGEPIYTTFMRDGQPAFGCIHLNTMPDMKQVPEHWFTYFHVDDVDKSAKALAAAGGMVIRPPWDIPGVGRIAIVKDVNGAMLGLGKPAPMAAAPEPKKSAPKAKKAKA